MRKTLIVLLGLVLATVAVSGHAVAIGHRPGEGHRPGHGRHGHAFEARLSGIVYFVPAPRESQCTDPPLITASRANGYATHVGHLWMKALHCSGNDVTGAMILGTRDGSVVLRYRALCTPVPPFPPVVTCDGHFRVMSGKGRFAGARGLGHLEVATDPPQHVADPLKGKWPARWTLRGWIRP